MQPNPRFPPCERTRSTVYIRMQKGDGKCLSGRSVRTVLYVCNTNNPTDCSPPRAGGITQGGLAGLALPVTARERRIWPMSRPVLRRSAGIGLDHLHHLTLERLDDTAIIYQDTISDLSTLFCWTGQSSIIPSHNGFLSRGSQGRPTTHRR
jgi:hypothetical protein